MKKNSNDSITDATKTSYSVQAENRSLTQTELSVIEFKKRRNNAILQEKERLSGISGRTAIIFALFIVIIKLAEQYFPPFGELIGVHSFRGQAILMLLIVGIIPFLTSVLIILLERPAAKFICGEAFTYRLPIGVFIWFSLDLFCFDSRTINYFAFV